MSQRGAPELDFGSLNLSNADCFVTAGVTANGNPLTFQCGGSMKSVAGLPSYQLTFSIAVKMSDWAAKVAALRENTQDTLDFFPYGNSTGNPKRSATLAIVATASYPNDPTALTMVDITMDLDDLVDSVIV